MKVSKIKISRHLVVTLEQLFPISAKVGARIMTLNPEVEYYDQKIFNENN